MSFVAIATAADHVTIVRDSVAYTPDGATVIPTAKTPLVLPSRLGLTTSRGDHTLGTLWEQAARALAARTRSFDHFTVGAVATLHRLVPMINRLATNAGHASSGDPHTLHVYLAGHSGRTGAFTSYILRSEHDFRPEPLEPLHVIPAPVGTAWSSVETDHWSSLADAFSAAGLNQPDPPRGTPPTLPTNDADWSELVRHTHATRACAHPHTGLKVLIGGTVTLTTFTREQTRQRRLFTFTRAQTAAMLRDTRAATGSASATGRRTPQPEPGCPPRNAPCPCGSGSKFKRCCGKLGTPQPAY